MNVKIWIPDVVSEYFRMLDLRKAEDFRGGFEPIPDLVIFRPEIAGDFGPEIVGDFRRRNHTNTFDTCSWPPKSRHPSASRAGYKPVKSAKIS
jgi:hypothetical protein